MGMTKFDETGMPILDYSSLELYKLSLQDMVGTFIFAVLLTVARKNVQQYFFEFAKRDGIDADKRKKYSESVWKVLYYVSVFTWGAYLVIENDTFPNTINTWLRWPHQQLSLSVQVYYVYQLGFYVHSTYCHFTMEVKRSDFWPLLFHHLATIFLIYFSMLFRFHYFGMLVLVCHDAGDIPLEAGKLAVYRKREKEQVFWYLVLVLTWICTRLTVFPKLIYCGWYESNEMLGWIPLHDPFNYFLMFLQVLHVYWFFLILRIGYTALTNKESLNDEREKDD